MVFRIDLPDDQRNYGYFIVSIRHAMQHALDNSGITVAELAKRMKTDENNVGQYLMGQALSLRVINDFYTALGRMPLDNYVTHSR